MIKENTVELHVLKLAVCLLLVSDNRQPARKDPQRISPGFLHCHTLVPLPLLVFYEFSPQQCALVCHALKRVCPLIATL